MPVLIDVRSYNYFIAARQYSASGYLVTSIRFTPYYIAYKPEYAYKAAKWMFILGK